ncbi:MAG: hypothetical protein Tsb005_12270 [Gammaproteobacteria bacterium]
MSKSIVVTSGKGERLEVTIVGIPGWEGFDKLILFLIKHYDASVLEKYDGPDARRWILECRNQTIELIHDDMFGNYLLAPTVKSEDVIREIANDLEERLKDI